VIINYQGERTILSYYPDAEGGFEVKDEVEPGWVYLTTAGKSYEAFYQEAVEWAKKSRAKIAFNPGSRQIKDGIEKNRFAYEAAEIIFINKEEAARLLHVNANDASIKDLLSGMRGVGPKLVIITDGPDGAYSFDGNEYLFMPIVPGPVVERTGAGDAFGSGFLAGIMQGLPVKEALRWGTCNSGSVLMYVGPQRGLLTKDQMVEWLKKSEEIKPREI
ncbi:MAG: carbohydrate kinase family protein, partial [candidate division Zixibacteria bacterium]|nr:carbohydrate kinase family protein [candidate division Zixibacteria bacterium]